MDQVKIKALLDASPEAVELLGTLVVNGTIPVEKRDEFVRLAGIVTKTEGKAAVSAAYAIRTVRGWVQARNAVRRSVSASAPESLDIAALRAALAAKGKGK